MLREISQILLIDINSEKIMNIIFLKVGFSKKRKLI